MGEVRLSLLDIGLGQEIWTHVHLWDSLLCTLASQSDKQYTRGVQKVRSLIQLTTEYERDILSLFNIVPFNRNALSPAVLQSPYYIVEEFLFLVLHTVSCGADDIIVVSKFQSFHEPFSFGNKWKEIEVTGGQIWRIRWVAEQFKTCISDRSQCLS